MGAREQRESQAAKRHPRQAPQKVRGRAKSEFQGEEDQRTKAETVVQRPKEQSVERAAKSNRITVNRATRSRLRQDMAVLSGGAKQIKRQPPGPQDRISFCPAAVFGWVCSMAHGEVSGRRLSHWVMPR